MDKNSQVDQNCEMLGNNLEEKVAAVPMNM